MVCYDKAIFVRDTTIWKSEGAKKKIAFKVVQIKFLTMHTINQKWSWYIYGKKCRIYLNGTWSLLNVLMIFGIKETSIREQLVSTYKHIQVKQSRQKRFLSLLPVSESYCEICRGHVMRWTANHKEALKQWQPHHVQDLSFHNRKMQLQNKSTQFYFSDFIIVISVW